MPAAFYVTMPSGQSYSTQEIEQCAEWWAKLEQTGRWWMVTEVYPTNDIKERVRVATAPFRDHFNGFTNQWLVEFCFIAHGSTEIEARILVMRSMQRAGKKKPSPY